MKQALIITGTPGTGKTTLANKLSLLFKKEVINISEYAKKHDLLEKYDPKSDTYDLSEKKLVKKLVKDIQNNEDLLIIEGHMSHFLPKNTVKLCIVCKTELKELRKRLDKRKYSEKKIKENLECEIFDICLNEALEQGHEVKMIDSKKLKKTDLTFIKNKISL